MAHEEPVERGPAWEVFLVALRLGLTSFGGPVAHLGYFREEYVGRRKWLDDGRFADLLALAQFLPGPASSQMGIAIGTLRAGYLGGFLAWVGFTLPSAALLIAFALAVGAADLTEAGWLHGLKVAAVAVVAQAVWAMARTLAPDRDRATIAILAAAVVLVLATPATQVLVIVAGGLVGWMLYRGDATSALPSASSAAVPRGSRGLAVAWAAIFVLLLMGLPLGARAWDWQALQVVDAFYRAGSLVFGGGHVVLPLLERAMVPPGWITETDFIAGYGAAQAVPGPLFTFAGYLGAASVLPPNGVAGGVLATAAIFLPSFLLVWAVLPVWDRIRGVTSVQGALKGVGAAVVGILGAALYDPVWTSAIFEARDLALAVVVFGLLAAWRVPAWAAVAVAALGGEVIASL